MVLQCCTVYNTVYLYIDRPTLLVANHNMVAYGTAGIQAHLDLAPRA